MRIFLNEFELLCLGKKSVIKLSFFEFDDPVAVERNIFVIYLREKIYVELNKG